ncbi:IS256 family transposase [Mycoplasmopsis felis]|nr:IS256 family transposase [Mycoplasmopsis felis]WQQ05084.1 IS256 family transposase [Mycoplasmopsis felis]
MEKEYAMVFIDGIRFKVKEENRLVEKSVYIVMGYTLEGQKDVLGFWIGESESAKYWMQVLNDLKLRGVQEIFIISSDNLTGISNAIKAVFPKTQIQKCVVHQIRNSVKFVNYKDLKEFTKDMKNIYQANNIDEATRFLQIFEDKWKDKYMYAIKSWRDNFEELVTFFNFPKEIRKLIYTTNIIENLNRNIRKITKTKTSFPTEESLMKSVYFAINNQLAKWDKITPNWGQILSQLLIIFKENN